MYKKFLALGIALTLTMTSAMTPVFAAEKQSSNTIKNQGFKSLTMKYQKPMIKKDKKNDKGINKLDDILKQFFDSDEIDWAQKSIEKMGAMGILNGKGEGLFKPKNNVTHAEAIAMVLKLTGYQKEAEAIKAQPEYFKGICDSWSYGYLELALQRGIIIPEEDGKFNPKTPAKRHEVAKYIVRALGMRDLALLNMNRQLDFKDASSIPATSVGYVYVATDLRIMQGAKDVFQPNKPITRAEMAVILDRAEGNFEEPANNAVTVQGTFIAYDKVNAKLTLNVNGKAVVYTVIPNAPVYKDSTYYTVDSLKAGDVIRVIMDSQKRIIFIEYKQATTPTIPTNERLSIQTMQYDLLPQAIKDKVEALKLTTSYAAFKYEQNIYLIAARGQMPTGGYAIKIKEAYKELIQTSKYNIKAVVEITNPSAGAVIQTISYPYDVVKLSFLSNIDKINFVGTDNLALAQTTITELDNVETINGKILAVDTTNRLLQVLESDNIAKSYLINSNIQITLNGQAATLASLSKDMLVTITRTNGIITRIAATTSVVTVTGKIDAVDAANRIMVIWETTSTAKSYVIPANAEITLNNQAAALASITKDMNATITFTNGVITKVAVQSDIQVLEGTLITVFSSSGKTFISVRVGTVINAYEVASDTTIYYNNQITTIQSFPLNSTIVMKILNNKLIEIRNK